MSDSDVNDETAGEGEGDGRSRRRRRTGRGPRRQGRAEESRDEVVEAAPAEEAAEAADLDDGDGDDEDDVEGDDGDEGDDQEGGGDAYEAAPAGGGSESRGEPQRRLDFRSLGELSQEKLLSFAKAQGFQFDSRWNKKRFLFEFYRSVVEKMSRGLTLSRGVLEILPEGYGFVRTQMAELDDTDVYVSQSQIRRFGLRTGDEVVGQVRPPKDNESYYALIKVEEVNGEDPARFVEDRAIFEKLVPLFPFERIRMERKDPKAIDVRLLDMICPIGKGQRGLIVAPPKAGKTTLLKSVANSITENHPECELIILLIDERPEEVTDIQRGVDAQVVASCFDQPVSNHIRVTEMVLEMAKRRVEMGKDVCILLDSITRLARAYNISVPSSGQTLSGGVNPHALYKPKRFFGSARKIENGGSLTILATALVDTGNKMDDFIYEEFKGTGNMELILDRDLFHKRLFPSVDIKLSSTRKDDLLLPEEMLKRTWVLRRVLASMPADEALGMMLKHLGRTASNAEFLASLNKADLS